MAVLFYGTRWAHADGGSEDVAKKKKRDRVRRYVAATMVSKRSEVEALIKQFNPECDCRNRGQVISSLIHLLRDNEEFRIQFIDIAVTEGRRTLRRRSGKASGEPINMAKDSHGRPEDHAMGIKRAESNNFLNVVQDRSVLLTEIKEVFQSTTPEDMAAQVDRQEMSQRTGRYLLIGAAVIAGIWIIKKMS